MTANELSYTDIRRLRGAKTRAAFAAQVGVDPQTVYRWELPPSSAQSRRPRGRALARLRELVSVTAQVDRDASLPPSSEPWAGAPRESGASIDLHEEELPIAAALQRVLDGEWREAESVFLRAVSDRRGTAQVLASCGLASIELLYRADGRRALAVLSPALAASAPPFALAEALAALAYSFPDGDLFDVGRVHAHARRAEELGRGESPSAVALATGAEVGAAVLSGDDDLLGRALSRVDQIAIPALPETVAMYVEHLRAVAAFRMGQARVAQERVDRLIANPRLERSPPLEARVLAMHALRILEELGDPNEALAFARRARAIADGARLPVGTHSSITLRAEGEALFRLGSLEDAGHVFAEADRILDEQRFPALIVLPAELRYLFARSDANALQGLADRLQRVELPSMRSVAQAFAAWFAATAALVRGDDSAQILTAFERVARMSERWAPIHRDVLIAYANATITVGTPAETRAVFARARRDRSQTAWSSAHLRRIEGVLLIGEGRFEEGRVIFDAAAATFEACGDRVAAMLARYAAARMLMRLGDTTALPRIAEIESELAAIGVPRPEYIVRGVDRSAAAFADATTLSQQRQGERRQSNIAPALEVALQRLAVGGANRDMICRELIAVTRDLVGSAAVLTEADDSIEHDATTSWFDIGRPARLRLGVTEPLDEQARGVVRVLAAFAGVALEAAAVRGDGSEAPVTDVSEIPGLVAASSVMKRLLADIARLAGSRATVVITGESGVGKELVARALHDTSSRASQPYIAFNCSAVPHELFEGHLFGHRKGAFTGANADQAGVVRAADGGTLFLDEIGELPLAIQPKLLRFLDNAEVFPLGAQRPVTVDVRVVAASNRDLLAEVRRGRFREDLYYRLQVVPLVVPPLRARREDIVPLARYFARSMVADGPTPAFTPDALAALSAYGWPGNVRELRNVISRALAYSPRPTVITRTQLAL
jgi:predicted ATP-dependent protease